MFACVAYFIWGQRNKLVHEKVSPNPTAVVRRAQLLLSGILESIQTQRHARQNGGENLNQQSSGDRW